MIDKIIKLKNINKEFDFLIDNIIKNNDIHYKNENWSNLLHLLVKIGDFNNFKYFYDYIDCLDNNDWYSPLHFCLLYNQLNIFKFIVSNVDSKILLKNNFLYKTILDYSLELEKIDFINCILDNIDVINYNKLEINNVNILYINKFILLWDLLLFQKFINKISDDYFLNIFKLTDPILNKNIFWVLLSSDLDSFLKYKFFLVLLTNNKFINNNIINNIDYINKDVFWKTFFDYLFLTENNVFILNIIDTILNFKNILIIYYSKEKSYIKKNKIQDNLDYVESLLSIIFYSIEYENFIIYNSLVTRIIYSLENNDYKNHYFKKIFKKIILTNNLKFLEIFFKNNDFNELIYNNENFIVTELIYCKNSLYINHFLNKTSFFNWTILRIFKIIYSKILFNKMFFFNFQTYRFFKIIFLYFIFVLLLLFIIIASKQINVYLTYFFN